MVFQKWLWLLKEQTLTEWREHYVCYKHLKRDIKLITSAAAEDKNSRPEKDEDCLDRFESGFIHLLNQEIHKINKFTEMKTEEYYGRLQVLKDRIDLLKNTTESSKAYVRKEVVMFGNDLVNIYGEMVLLDNYSVWNYTRIKKIVKKYNRHMHGVLRDRYSIWVECIPCFEATVSLSKLLSDCKSIEQSVQRSSIAYLEILKDMVRIEHA